MMLSTYFIIGALFTLVFFLVRMVLWVDRLEERIDRLEKTARKQVVK